MDMYLTLLREIHGLLNRNCNDKLWFLSQLYNSSKLAYVEKKPLQFQGDSKHVF